MAPRSDIPLIDIGDLIRAPCPAAHERIAAEIFEACTR